MQPPKQPLKQPQVSTSLTLMPAQLLASHLQLLERPSLGLLFLRIKLKLNFLDKKKIKTNTIITIQNKETDNGNSGFQIIMSTQAKAVESNIILPDCNYKYCNHYYYEGFHHQELLKEYYHVITIPIQLILLILLLRLNTTTAPKMEFHL